MIYRLENTLILRKAYPEEKHVTCFAVLFVCLYLKGHIVTHKCMYTKKQQRQTQHATRSSSGQALGYTIALHKQTAYCSRRANEVPIYLQ